MSVEGANTYKYNFRPSNTNNKLLPIGAAYELVKAAKALNSNNETTQNAKLANFISRIINLSIKRATEGKDPIAIQYLNEQFIQLKKAIDENDTLEIHKILNTNPADNEINDIIEKISPKEKPISPIISFLRQAIGSYPAVSLASAWHLVEGEEDKDRKIQERHLGMAAISHLVYLFQKNGSDRDQAFQIIKNLFNETNLIPNTLPVEASELNELFSFTTDENEQNQQNVFGPTQLQEIISNTRIDDEHSWKRASLANALLELAFAETVIESRGFRTKQKELHDELKIRIKKSKHFQPTSQRTIDLPSELIKIIEKNNDTFIINTDLGNGVITPAILEIGPIKSEASVVRKMFAKKSINEVMAHLNEAIDDKLRLRVHIPDNLTENQIEAMCIHITASIMQIIGDSYLNNSESLKWTFNGSKSNKFSSNKLKFLKAILKMQTDTDTETVELQITQNYPNDHDEYSERQVKAAIRTLGIAPQFTFEEFVYDLTGTFLEFINNFTKASDEIKHLVKQNINYDLYAADTIINIILNPENENKIREIINKKPDFKINLISTVSKLEIFANDPDTFGDHNNLIASKIQSFKTKVAPLTSEPPSALV